MRGEQRALTGGPDRFFGGDQFVGRYGVGVLATSLGCPILGQDIGRRGFEQGIGAQPRIDRSRAVDQDEAAVLVLHRQTDRKQVHDLLEQIGVALSLLLALAQLVGKLAQQPVFGLGLVGRAHRQRNRRQQSEFLPDRHLVGIESFPAFRPQQNQQASAAAHAERQVEGGLRSRDQIAAAGSTSHPTRARSKWPKRARRLARNGPPRSSCVRPDPPARPRYIGSSPSSLVPAPSPGRKRARRAATGRRSRTDRHRGRSACSASNALTSNWAWRACACAGSPSRRRRDRGFARFSGAFHTSMTRSSTTSKAMTE